MSAAAILPPEWAPQSAVLLTWPHADGDWAEQLEEAERCFTVIAREISRRQALLITCHGHAKLEDVRKRLVMADAELGRIRLYAVPSNDTWARDHGPITVLRNGQPVLLNFRFNGWGGKYAHDLDDQVTRSLHAQGAFGRTPIEDVGVVLEGGGIEVNGAGALLTTVRCLLSPTRNPHLDRKAVESLLGLRFGTRHCHWLQHGGLEGDDTDGHIDTLARFCSADTIAYQGCDDPADPHYEELGAMAEELRALRQADGTAYHLQALPWPRARYDADGKRLPATYANFLIINGAVLMPTYRDPADGRARAVLQTCFPKREVIGIDCCALIRQFGSLHCVTMQLPEGIVP